MYIDNGNTYKSVPVAYVFYSIKYLQQLVFFLILFNFNSYNIRLKNLI